MEAQGKDKGEIALMIEEQKLVIPEGELREPDHPVGVSGEGDSYNTFVLEEPAESAEELGLSEEDVTYLKLR